MLINVKMPTIVVVTLTFMSMLNATPESLKARKVVFFSSFKFLWAVQISCSVELSAN